ncbi:MAG: GNAT family N-acetyltransferase [Firmicutes bacterium]|uniref:N-acetyltransferase n=1 Tax=Sulfobacillus benefaciens TaxID=453960 RepID=A0A2T2WSG1_9FIRM|nr:GNAT family N-acetyltransferase [Bacillota bacterium]MCL5015464.1 GNAT family N-acetyltransferase [Bacillota bacterium]PSR25185.1 MAG: N-acetyltransferase [Sulfobacillus benefaciens]HBQ96431.1 N-acetyltransferase [Sulfobacillus sp.]
MLRYVRASLEDQAKVEEFLRRNQNDRLIKELGKLLSLTQGGLYLAIDDNGAIVGTAVLTLPKRHEAYLGQVQLASPNLDRETLKEFAAFQLEEAQKLGAHIVRATTGDDDELWASILQEESQFEPVEKWVVGTFEGYQVPEFPPLEAGPAWAVDKERIRKFMEPVTDALWAEHDLHIPTSLDDQSLENQFEVGGVAVAPQDGRIAVDSLVLYRIRNSESLDIKYFRSDGHYIHQVLDYLWLEARAWGISRLRVGLSEKTASQIAEALQVPIQREWAGRIFVHYINRELQTASI